jgi:bifunctional non-homologous end joining protein LigD
LSSEEEPSLRTQIEGRELILSHSHKVLYPATGFTKGQMLDYYAKVAPVLLPHLRDRPLTLKRYPNGVDQPWFYEKHAPGSAPTWIKRISVPTKKGGRISYLSVNDLPSLLWVANLATIELHVPLWHIQDDVSNPGPPDQLVFDLDPGEGTTVVECCVVAMFLAQELSSLGLDARAKTSGKKGLQVYVPLPSPTIWSETRERSHVLATTLEQLHPELVVTTMSKVDRRGKVLIDWSQNSSSKTMIAAYSLRATAEPTVSTPVTWEEVDRCSHAANPVALRFTASAVLERISHHGDLFAAI